MSSMLNISLYGNYRQRTFADIFPDVSTFTDAYNATPLALPEITTLDIIYYLLYANYGNSPIANSDENQFQYRLWSTIFSYAPTWQKRIEIQKKVRDLTENDILAGSSAIHNHAFNDGGQPSSSSSEPLDYINDQNVTLYKKSKVEGYAYLISLLETDVTKEFIDMFKPLFLTIVAPELPLWYSSDPSITSSSDIIGG